MARQLPNQGLNLFVALLNIALISSNNLVTNWLVTLKVAQSVWVSFQSKDGVIRLSSQQARMVHECFHHRHSMSINYNLPSMFHKLVLGLRLQAEWAPLSWENELKWRLQPTSEGIPLRDSTNFGRCQTPSLSWLHNFAIAKSCTHDSTRLRLD